VLKHLLRFQSFSDPIFIAGFVIGLSTGATVLVGQAWGAKDIEKVRTIVGALLFMTLIVEPLLPF
jgi:Na+-driven multidrug efflux pump